LDCGGTTPLSNRNALRPNPCRWLMPLQETETNVAWNRVLPTREGEPCFRDEEEVKVLEALKSELVQGSKTAFERGIVGESSGNLSTKDPETGLIAITASGIPYREMVEDDIIVLNQNGEILEGSKRPSSETPMHRVIYRRRAEVGAIVHFHSEFATCFAVANRPIPMVTFGLISAVGGDVQVAPYARPATEDLGLGALEKMGELPAALLRYHGGLAIGKTLRETLAVAEAVEEGARISLFASFLGKLERMPETEIPAFRNYFLKRQRAI
jgi:ribulose-5-phosphate 4-epimerase/fuculose-1-phosphate aldolase